jgi:hypothetical protein
MLSETLERANKVIAKFLEANSEAKSIPTLQQIEELSTAVAAVGQTAPNGVLSSNRLGPTALIAYQCNLRQLVFLLDSLSSRAADHRQDLAQQLSHLDKANAWITRTKLIATDSGD